MSDARRLGKEFEDQAADFLLKHGFTIIKRRYSCKGGEIDVVALEGETLVFVEVKGRQKTAFAAEESINDRKRSRIFRASRRYLNDFETGERSVRFDVVAIDPSGIRHHVDAFRPE